MPEPDYQNDLVFPPEEKKRMRSKKVNKITCTTRLQDLMNGKLSLKKNPSFKPKLGMWVLLDDGRVGKIIAEDTRYEDLKWAIIYQSEFEDLLSLCWWPNLHTENKVSCVDFISPINALEKTTAFDKLKKIILSSSEWENNIRRLWKSWRASYYLDYLKWAACIRDLETGGFKTPSAIWRNND